MVCISESNSAILGFRGRSKVAWHSREKSKMSEICVELFSTLLIYFGEHLGLNGNIFQQQRFPTLIVSAVQLCVAQICYKGCNLKEANDFFLSFSSVFIATLQQETCFLVRTMLPWFLTSACHVMSTKVVNMKIHPGYENLF